MMQLDSSHMPSAFSASGHAWLHEPQLSASFVGSTQPLEQASRPPPHAPLQVPSLQTSAAPQVWPQTPQLAGSVVRSAQPDVHRVRPGGQPVSPSSIGTSTPSWASPASSVRPQSVDSSAPVAQPAEMPKATTANWKVVRPNAVLRSQRP